MGPHVQFPSVLGPWIAWTCAALVCRLLQFVWGHMWISPVVSGGHCFLGASITSGSYTIPIPFPYRSLSPGGRDWWRPPIYDWVLQSLSLSTHCNCGLCVSSHLPWGEAFLNIGSFVMVMEKSATWCLIFSRTGKRGSKTVKRRFAREITAPTVFSEWQGPCLWKQALNHCVRYSQGRVCNPKTQVSNLLYLRKGNTQLVSTSQQDIVVSFLLQAELWTSPVRRDSLWKCRSSQVSFIQLTCRFRRQSIRSLKRL